MKNETDETTKDKPVSGVVSGVVWSREFIQHKQRGVIQVMVGRTRKMGRREPNGRIARAYRNPKQQVASQPHRMAIAAKFREWPEAGSEFGRLMLNGLITPAQHEAGKMYAQLADKYRVVLGIPPLHPVSMDLRSPKGGMGADIPVHIARAIKRDYDAAFEACGEAGVRAQKAVKDYAVFEECVLDADALANLKGGLNKLVAHFAIDENLRISHGQK